MKLCKTQLIIPSREEGLLNRDEPLKSFYKGLMQWLESEEDTVYLDDINDAYQLNSEDDVEEAIEAKGEIGIGIAID